MAAGEQSPALAAADDDSTCERAIDYVDAFGVKCATSYIALDATILVLFSAFVSGLMLAHAVAR